MTDANHWPDYIRPDAPVEALMDEKQREVEDAPELAQETGEPSTSDSTAVFQGTTVTDLQDAVDRVLARGWEK